MRPHARFTEAALSLMQEIAADGSTEIADDQKFLQDEDEDFEDEDDMPVSETEGQGLLDEHPDPEHAQLALLEGGEVSGGQWFGRRRRRRRRRRSRRRRSRRRWWKKLVETVVEVVSAVVKAGRGMSGVSCRGLYMRIDLQGCRHVPHCVAASCSRFVRSLV